MTAVAASICESFSITVPSRREVLDRLSELAVDALGRVVTDDPTAGLDREIGHQADHRHRRQGVGQLRQRGGAEQGEESLAGGSEPGDHRAEVGGLDREHDQVGLGGEAPLVGIARPPTSSAIAMALPSRRR